MKIAETLRQKLIISSKTSKGSAVKIDDTVPSMAAVARERRPVDTLSIRLRGSKESNKKSTCERMQLASEVVSEVLYSLIDSQPPITNVKKLRKYDS